MRRPGRLARRVLVGVTVVAVVGGGYAAYAAGADDASYRTVVATTGDVQETLEVSGTVEPVGRADLSFATSGTIDTIDVETGDHVKHGQVLGTLETTTLRNAVRHARSDLASARAQLESDEDAQTSTVSSASGSSTPTQAQSQAPDRRLRPRSRRSPPDPATDRHPDEPTDTPTQGSGGSDALDEALAQLAAEQDAVTSAQSTVSASLAAANDALAAQQAACATAFTTGDDPPATALATARATTLARRTRTTPPARRP